MGRGGGQPPLPSSPEVATPPSGDDDRVMSEVHLGCPPTFSGPFFSRFTISLPSSQFNDVVKEESSFSPQALSLDDDGDLVLTRCRKQAKRSFVVTICHNITSSIPSVGLQVWKAELVLADFVLHIMFMSSELNGIIAAELGAGTGLVGLLLARVAKKVFLTDRGNEVLNNCTKNVQLNSEIFSSQASVCVRELDWKNSWPPPLLENSPSRERYAWTPSEAEELQRATLLIAADVIYCDDLTDAFFGILERLMSQNQEKMLYLALEKRYNFTLDDLSIVANGYSRFRNYLREEGEYDDGLENGLPPCFVGKSIDVAQIPQYVREYDRGNDVEIWQIKYEKRKPPTLFNSFQ